LRYYLVMKSGQFQLPKIMDKDVYVNVVYLSFIW